ncbi:alpha/beta hydrolase [Actinomyces bowdenii]|uniref:Alpha/beta fold hydrolase n=1 Tax=Actinomyces bowdenii TaxID=131109 RepID=A0A853ERN3_9ACTO|nr:alpha/beta hydrolase [Actinomyces bowdenii]MBF0698154.1 alpha/beta fold hydrolase [Actinomyces bowdenii]NYS70326.1 alpha/beta fold hydrolase [Actinomyces bowdenii]
MAVSTALALGATAIAAVPADRHPHDEATIPAGLERFYGQDVEWYPCVADGGMTASQEDTGFQCATVEVPLDYENPEGQTIQIAMKKHEATADKREGSLFINPGGPGGSGVTAVQGLAQPEGGLVSTDVAAAYDVIGFDPRGVGASTAIRCEPPAGADAADGAGAPADGQAAADQTPQDPGALDSLGDPLEPEDSPADPGTEPSFVEQIQGYQAYAAQRAAQCAQYTQPAELLDHVDTVSAARDLDVLRALSGEYDLDYLGYSYGTYLGAIYAELFPENTGRLVLDGAVDPALNQAQSDREQSLAFEASRRAYLEHCLGAEDCPLSGDVDAASAQLDDFIRGLEAEPLPTADPAVQLTGAHVESAIVWALYRSEAWPALTQGLAQAMTQGDGSILAQMAGVGEEVVRGDAGQAITCLDYPVEGDIPTWEQNYLRDVADAPHYGGRAGDAFCQAWGHNGTRAPAPIHARTAAPILVIGTTGDPATPYSGAVALAEQLDSGELLTWEGNGHVAYTRAGDCVNKAVDAYLLTGQMPQDGLVCTGQE